MIRDVEIYPYEADPLRDSGSSEWIRYGRERILCATAAPFRGSALPVSGSSALVADPLRGSSVPVADPLRGSSVLVAKPLSGDLVFNSKSCLSPALAGIPKTSTNKNLLLHDGIGSAVRQQHDNWIENNDHWIENNK